MDAFRAWRAAPLDAEYLLPLKWAEDTGLDELVEYLELLSTLRVLVVDGSCDELYFRHDRVFPAGVFHCLPRHPECRNGKVGGVLTGVDLVEAQQLIITGVDPAEAQQLDRICALLEEADVVRPELLLLTLSPAQARPLGCRPRPPEPCVRCR